jgi:hypothetical protein
MDRNQDPFGEQAMADCVVAGRDRTLEQSVAGLLETVEQWCQPAGPLDDVSILGLQWLGTTPAG